MFFARVVDGVFGDFHNQILAGDNRLTTQARIGFQTPSLIEQVFFQFGRLFFRLYERLFSGDCALSAQQCRLKRAGFRRPVFSVLRARG